MTRQPKMLFSLQQVSSVIKFVLTSSLILHDNIRIDRGLRADCVHNGKNERNFNRIEFVSPH